MDRNNNFKVNEDFVVDIELLRMAALIENREKYEEEFFSLEPPTDELDHIISRHFEKFDCDYIFEEFQQDLDNPFELEDYLDQLRDEKLIKEREIYEASYFSKVNLPEWEFLDIQIEDRESEMMEGYDFCDFEYEEEMYWNIYYLKKSQFEQPSTCGCAYMDYMPHDDLCDYLDCYDYPEGPDENLNGIKLF